MREAIRARILARSDRAGTIAQETKADPARTQQRVAEAIYQYVCCKFLLDPEENRGKSLAALAERSLETAIENHIPIAKESETATTCGAAGSSAMKVALLLNAVKKDFGVVITPQRLGRAKDPAELGELVWRAMCGEEL